jgi:hypothetical protein
VKLLNCTPTILSYRPFKSGSLTAYVSIIFPAWLIIHNIAYFVSHDGGRRVDLPVQFYKNRNGEDARMRLVEFASAELKAEFQQQILAAIDRFKVGENG